MSGTNIDRQYKYKQRTTRVVRHFVGSFWPQIGVGPTTVLSSQTVNGFHEWNNVRTTAAQTPFWREIKKRGLNVTTDLQGTKARLQLSQPGNIQYRVRTGVGTSTEYHDVYTYEGNLMSFAAQTGGFISDQEVLDLAAVEFYKKARQAQTQLQALVVTGEFAQTLAGIKHTVTTIRNGMWGYLDTLRKEKSKRGRRRTLREHNHREITEYLSDQWLSYSFGWKPLLSDLDDSMKYLATDTEVLSESVPVKAVGKKSAGGFSGVQSGAGFEHRTYSEETVTATYHGKVSRNVSGFALFGDATSARAGLDPSNWLPSIWELIPYSFLIDYFSNVQEVISAYTFNQQSTMWVNRTIRREVKTYPVDPRPTGLPSGGTVDVLEPGEHTWTYTSVDRKGGEGPGVPSLALQIPGFGSTKWLNMATLIASSKGMSPYVW